MSDGRVRGGTAALLRLANALLGHPANVELRRRLRNRYDAASVFSREATIHLFEILLRGRGISPGTNNLWTASPLDRLTWRLEEPDRRAIVGLLPANLSGLGAGYEELQALSPRLDTRRWSFELEPIRGSMRKRLGSYSTPPLLIEPLLNSALDPVLSRGLSLKVCDPACGSGGFLLAVAQRLSRSLSLPQVVKQCLFGVDRDPLAVELCKLALWETCDGVVPLSILAEHIRCGNSLIGVPPRLDPPDNHDCWTAARMGGNRRDVAGMRERHGFFHWKKEFPAIFDGSKDAGFDLILGNPPWERVKHQRSEWPETGARARKEDQRRAREESRFLRESGRFPLSARGDLNYYGPFVETCRRLVRPGGYVGLVVPSGIATDDSMKALFQSLMREDLVSWYDFHNRGRIFPAVQGNVKFGLLTLRSGKRTGFSAAAQLSNPDELNDPGRKYILTEHRVARLNPNTLHCPPFSSARDARLVARLHDHFPILMLDGTLDDNPWGLSLGTMFHMTKDAGLFQREKSLCAGGWKLDGNVFHKGKHTCLPLYEAKLIRQWTHRGSTFAGVPESKRYRIHAGTLPLASANECVLPRYWVDEAAVRARAGEARWFLGFRNAISAVADARSLVAAVIPRAPVGNSLPLIGGMSARRTCLLLALLNSFVVDYVLRQKASGGNLNFHVLKQLPLPTPDMLEGSLSEWLIECAFQLTYTSAELRHFAEDCGCNRVPFAFDEERRWQLCCEIDASLFRLYGLSRGEVELVLGSFPVLERRERHRFGCFRSREQIVELYDMKG
jgi:hypothetical protein